MCSFVCCVSFDRGVILCDVLFVCCLIVNPCHRVKTHLQLINFALHYIHLRGSVRGAYVEWCVENCWVGPRFRLDLVER
jgi:hypothetical protein